MRYSNIVPLHERSARRARVTRVGRERWNQCSGGTSPLAMASSEVSRASDASRS